jgi:histidine ammonia-lyase
MRVSLDRVVRSYLSAEQPSAWLDALGSIAEERARVEELLSTSPEARIYGFTTLLGHLDSLGIEDVAPAALLRAHLIGPIRNSPAAFLKLVTLCKCEQLHHGGSGIHSATYEHVLAAAIDDRSDATGSWLSSYGSGDVVPAAWWIASIFGTDATDLHRGDVIALLNGTFFSTALGVAASVAGVDLIAQFLARTTLLCPLPAGSAERVTSFSARILGAFNQKTLLGGTGDAQLPISVRDAAAFLLPAATVVTALGDALETRLAGSSTNPLFTTNKDGGISAQSQSSFLDLRLTFALTNLIQYLHLTIGATQRMIVHLCERELSGNATPDPRFVQPPKVAQALVERARMVAGQLPAHFAGSESNGIEDVRDLSLLTAESVLQLVEVGRDVLDLLDAVLSLIGAETRGPLELFESELIGLLLGDSAGEIRDIDAAEFMQKFSALSEPIFSRL